jgi:hypothetical protein
MTITFISLAATNAAAIKYRWITGAQYLLIDHFRRLLALPRRESEYFSPVVKSLFRSSLNRPTLFHYENSIQHYSSYHSPKFHFITFGRHALLSL